MPWPAASAKWAGLLCDFTFGWKGAGGADRAKPRKAQFYRLRLITAEPLSLCNRTVCDLPCNTMLITPDIPYSLLWKLPAYLFSPTWRTLAVWEARPEGVAQVASSM
jgi:hypothetical protein